MMFWKSAQNQKKEFDEGWGRAVACKQGTQLRKRACRDAVKMKQIKQHRLHITLTLLATAFNVCLAAAAAAAAREDNVRRASVALRSVTCAAGCMCGCMTW